VCIAAVVLVGCDQLGNPEQFATGPTVWTSPYGRLATTTRSFRDESTIRRLVAEGMSELDYADPSIGPRESLTIVVVVPRALRQIRRRRVDLVTTFKLRDRRPISRRWAASISSDRWSAAFALPEPPVDAITSLVP
jgi:hypothetical protein